MKLQLVKNCRLGNKVGVVECLLRAGASPNTRSCILVPMPILAHRLHPAAGRSLTHKRKNVLYTRALKCTHLHPSSTGTVDKSSVLHVAAAASNPGAVLLLLKHKADPGMLDINGNSALHVARFCLLLLVPPPIASSEDAVDAVLVTNLVCAKDC